ncbi:monosaccharide ABC transporter substrate-binding protein (CUT2 family) [Nocardia tenerifensis]|uniref:Monosaccharide ABC transporter substrate-binding protein (CUT2 family) n=1 Tax=Nocardia tenerifensis TaxID=228006 RepID=A0A318KA51_9NOCA|nr:sugar ABC transporter substrate-binding protein [Nocardia tenerifensis]PXX71441.1 monosaccharide ABC transporter substrate-binding protein (CUT2 family) [Nocardia tenerifensis]
MNRPNNWLRGAIACCALVLVACGSGTRSADGPKSGTLRMAFVYATTSQNPFQEMALGAAAGAADAGDIDLTETAPPGINGPQEVSQFQAAVRTARDGIAMETLTPDLFVRPLQQAAAAGVPLATVDTVPPAGTKVGLYVGNDNTELGRSLATEIIKQIPVGTTGEVVLGNDIPGLDLLSQRLEGMKAVLQEQRPTLTVLGPFDTGSEPTDNYNKWNNTVKAHPNAVAYLGAGASDAVSLALIQKNTGRRLLVGSCDPDSQALAAVKDGYAAALASPEHWLKGYIAIRLLAEHARTGKPLTEGWWNPGGLIINAANIDEIIARQQNDQSRRQWFADAAARQLAAPADYLRPLSEAK